MADAPDGTGLGSSGSYLVALLTALFELKREKVPTQGLAEMAVHIEMDLAGHPVGKQDHYLAAFGGITCLNIDRDGKVQVIPLDISITTTEELRNSLLLFFTGSTRKSLGILQQQKEDTLRADAIIVDSLHRTRELGYRVKAALEAGDLEEFGLLLDEHWQNKKRRSAKISNEQIDRWYELAKENGALGGKIVGAGGGGFLMLFCPNSSKAAVRQCLSAAGLKEVSFDFDFEGAKVLVNF
jgi:D-glycero-alpha-D-manno-heptose-7-phosphate kinase